MSKKYTIGIDFGTLSGRALLVDAESGRELGCAVMDYPHAVIDSRLPESGEVLPLDFALQDPLDYIEVLSFVIPEVCRIGGVSTCDVVGICIDFTTCTVLPIKADGTPLSSLDEFKANKHAYVKLWKHHAAQPYADKMTSVALSRGERWLSDYGGKISSEWLFPKLLETACEAPEVTDAADYYIEAGDWLSLLLCGRQSRSFVYATWKALYSADKGYPSVDYLSEVDERLPALAARLLDAPIAPAGACIGRVTEEASRRFSLPVGCAVTTPMPDAHVAAPAVGLLSPGEMYGVFGTSNCYYTLSGTPLDICGICGCLKNGVMPNYYGLEAGLCCVGDHFAWVADQLCPDAYKQEADALGISPLALLIRKAAKKRPGEAHLLALDWWNGNRNILVDANLSGMLIGMNLRTTAEDILRALIEATAFATRLIKETVEGGGIEISSLIAAGGIARKDPFTMQIYSDVLGIPIRVVSTAYAPSLGSAIYAAVGAGLYPDVYSAAQAMMSPTDRIYTPNPEAGAVYERLYKEYLILHDYFGRGENDVMKRLMAITKDATE